ncbi:MAG: GNAT family N-acetyltransferase [Hydrogenophaga sp.]|nr:GNAT family N-acetyltransferase [Hydrogenophaga sp.]MDP3325987.1 GNAT family N-acetyltransferase [Hydrogenophaga sp.]
MSLLIREATEADLPGVLALYGQSGLDNDAVLTVAQAREVFQQFARYPSYRLFVACEPAFPDSVIATYALLVMHNLAHCGAPSAIAEDVVVHPQRQGLGIGRQLMAHAIEQAREAGCYKLALSSNARRQAAHTFYESLGFQRHGLSFVIET